MIPVLIVIGFFVAAMIGVTIWLVIRVETPDPERVDITGPVTVPTAKIERVTITPDDLTSASIATNYINPDRLQRRYLGPARTLRGRLIRWLAR